MAGFCRTGTDTVCKQFIITLKVVGYSSMFHLSLTWLLLYLFLPLDRVLQMCHQTQVGTVIGFHQVSQHREEAGWNAVRRLKSRSTAHAHYSSDRCRKMRCYFCLIKSGVGVLLLPDHHCSIFRSLVLLGSNGIAGGSCTTFPTLHHFSLIFKGEQLFLW